MTRLSIVPNVTEFLNIVKFDVTRVGVTILLWLLFELLLAVRNNDKVVYCAKCHCQISKLVMLV